FLLFAAVVGLLASAPCPVVLVLDDLQAADPATFALLRYVVDASHSMRMLLVGVYRVGEPTPEAFGETLAWLRRQPGAEVVELAGLDGDDVAALVEAGTAGAVGSAAADVARQLERDTGG